MEGGSDFDLTVLDMAEADLKEAKIEIKPE